MNDAVLVAIITAVVTLIGVILSTEKASAVQKDEIRTLREEIALHNNFARRLPKVESQMDELAKRIEILEKNQRE